MTGPDQAWSTDGEPVVPSPDPGAPRNAGPPEGSAWTVGDHADHADAAAADAGASPADGGPSAPYGGVVSDDLVGLARPPRVAGMMAAYFAARLGLFAVVTLLARLVGASPLAALVVGALISVPLSWPLLGRQRVAVARALEARRTYRASVARDAPVEREL